MTSDRKHGFAETNGIRMHYVEQGAGPAVLLLHGFPELWYSWRHQLPALASAGFRAIAPDLRGYGETDKPHGVRDYDIHHLRADLAGLLDFLAIERAAVVGHDWGSIIAWHLALTEPARVPVVVSLNVPFLPRTDVKPTDMFRAAPDGRFNYILAFQPEGIAEAQMERDLKGTLGAMMRNVSAAPDSLPEADLQVYIDAFAKGGLRGPINYYRNFDHNWETTPELAGRRVLQPALMVLAEKDPVLIPAMADAMEALVPNVRKHLIRDCGHWTQQEKPDDTNGVLIDFLKEHAPW
jgi:pimeloyl-ACP methyl ester carboxylesterase